jgi:hypothetical protein
MGSDCGSTHVKQRCLNHRQHDQHRNACADERYVNGGQ